MTDDGRRQRGQQVWSEILSGQMIDPTDPFQAATVDFLGAEVWARPGLSRKERRWISLSCAATSGQAVPIRAHVSSALESGDITLAELREFILHLAGYAGWPTAVSVSMVLAEFADRFEVTGNEPPADAGARRDRAKGRP